jgi:general secretion pathway protein M
MSRWQRLANSSLGRAYLDRSDPDRRSIAILAVIFGLAIAWLVLWKPVSDWHRDTVSRLAVVQSTLDYVRANEAVARRMAEQGAGSEQSSLIPVITRAANAQQLTLNRLQPEEGGVLNVILEGQPFDKVYQWITQLEENNGVRARWVSIRSEDRAGYVNAQIRFVAAIPTP